jgi:hypothetical protein
MITFVITYEIRMDSQVTLIALIFFQNRSKYSTVKHNKDVLIDQSISISIIFLWIRAVSSESRQAPTKFIPPFIKIGLHILVYRIPQNPLYNLHVFNIFIINIMRNNRQDRYEDHNKLKAPELSNT